MNEMLFEEMHFPHSVEAPPGIQRFGAFTSTRRAVARFPLQVQARGSALTTAARTAACAPAAR